MSRAALRATVAALDIAGATQRAALAQATTTTATAGVTGACHANQQDKGSQANQDPALPGLVGPVPERAQGVLLRWRLRRSSILLVVRSAVGLPRTRRNVGCCGVHRFLPKLTGRLPVSCNHCEGRVVENLALRRHTFDIWRQDLGLAGVSLEGTGDAPRAVP